VPIQAVLLGMLTIPGDPAHLYDARRFVANAAEYATHDVDTAVLLTSELVTNSLQHSNSRHPDGTVTISVFAVPDGVVVEVIDGGGTTVPAVAGQPGQPGLFEGGGVGCDWSNCWRRGGATTAMRRAPSPGSS
jgi:anti-sigma regulatory factor (Ser/Thr protein kinase)